MKWNNGDILKSDHRDAIHPIVFLDGYDDSFFIGAMITSSGPNSYPDNVLMKETHFCMTDKCGKEYETRYGPSYLVDAKLLKRLEWQPFRKTGQLTDFGIEFINKITHEKHPIVWEEYLKNK